MDKSMYFERYKPQGHQEMAKVPIRNAYNERHMFAKWYKFYPHVREGDNEVPLHINKKSI